MPERLVVLIRNVARASDGEESSRQDDGRPDALFFARGRGCARGDVPPWKALPLSCPFGECGSVRPQRQAVHGATPKGQHLVDVVQNCRSRIQSGGGKRRCHSTGQARSEVCSLRPPGASPLLLRPCCCKAQGI